ncbi:hypothetical protein ACFLWB_00860 [Chloroflexota bacterium]
MRRHLISIITLMVTSGLVIGCAPDLPKEVGGSIYALAYEAGYSWGYDLTAEDRDRKDLLWTPPDKVDDAQKFNPKVNIRDFYIPKGYWTIDDVANARFPDGIPFNEKQKKRVMEANNWGFYAGFMQGVEEYLEGKPDRRIP